VPSQQDVQPPEDAKFWFDPLEIENLFWSAGFTQMRTETLGRDPPVVCVLASSPRPRQGPGD